MNIEYLIFKYIIKQKFPCKIEISFFFLIFNFLIFDFWIYYSVLPESPRWLYTQGRNEEADEIVQKMARVNKVDLPEKLNIVVKVTVLS